MLFIIVVVNLKHIPIKVYPVPLIYHDEGTSSQVHKHGYHFIGSVVLIQHWCSNYRVRACHARLEDIEATKFCENSVGVSLPVRLKLLVGTTKIMWQSWVEIKHYSVTVAHFDRITAFV